ncbi:hypothetical protein C8Q80DRAFT_482968 [Daedaleopsis nitida]|nr:hypothetical protein C8Q80DRAFT_482968 [Daedaleopsis nitida]
MSLSFIPIELLQEILAFALHIHPRPTAVLCVNRTFFELGQPLLHAHLRFRSITHLTLFAKSTAALVCAPRSLEIKLAGGEADFEVFKHLTGALRRCLQSIRVASGSSAGHAVSGNATNAPLHDVCAENDPHATEDASRGEQVPLDVLSLQLHSHSRNPHLSYIYEALSLANPKKFIWKGPDPEHHFSTAIVPSATYHLIRAVSTWTAVEHITLTNMSFPSDELGRTFARDVPLLPPLPTLRTLHIGQATLLPQARSPRCSRARGRTRSSE